MRESQSRVKPFLFPLLKVKVDPMSMLSKHLPIQAYFSFWRSLYKQTSSRPPPTTTCQSLFSALVGQGQMLSSPKRWDMETWWSYWAVQIMLANITEHLCWGNGAYFSLDRNSGSWRGPSFFFSIALGYSFWLFFFYYSPWTKCITWKWTGSYFLFGC